jgi:hypothetical protein
MNERHVYIIEGISREAFMETGVRLTTGEEDLEYYVHDHKYSAYGDEPCNGRCTLIRQGLVMDNTVDVTTVTLLADAQPHPRA